MYAVMYGEQVRELRQEKGLSRLELAAAAGISAGAVSRVERAEPVQVRTAKAVAKALEVDPPQRLGRPA